MMRVLGILSLFFSASFPLAAQWHTMPSLLTPETPISITFHTGVTCDCGPTDSSVAIAGSEVRISLWRLPDAAVCPPDCRDRSITVNVGQLPVGEYRGVAEYGTSFRWPLHFEVRNDQPHVPPIEFEPAAPDSRMPVLAYVRISCPALPAASVERRGNSIGISFPNSCIDGGQLFTIPVDLGVLPAGLYEVSLGLENLAIGLGEAKLAVRDANPRFQVRPNVADGAGNPFDRVRITGKNITQCAVGPSPVVCAPVTVRFGDAVAETISIALDEIIVRPPAHESGTVDVSFYGFRVPAAFHYYRHGEPPDPAFFERVLFPLFFSGPGNFGTQWRTDATLANANEFPIDSPGPTFFSFACFPLCDPRPPANSMLIAEGGSSRSGHVIWFPRQAMPRLHFGLLVRDLSRQSEALGAEVPVVREGDLFASTFEIVNVPADARFRLTLRLYHLKSPYNFRLRIWPMRNEQIAIVDTLISTGVVFPYTAVIDDLITAYPMIAGRGPLRVQIDNESSTPSAWGFISAANNQTQHVTVISPQ